MCQVTSLKQLDLNKQYTYTDYLTWRIKDRIELIKGYIHRMSPAPSTNHQKTSGRIFVMIFRFIDKSDCEVFSAPFDVRFRDVDGVVRDIVQPDISVICDSGKLGKQGCIGAPDLIVEILSPSSSKRDLSYKYDLYRSHGVQEYWVVHPEEKTLLIYTLKEDGTYQSSKLFTRGDRIESKVLKGLVIPLDDVFDPFDWSKVEEEVEFYHRI